MNILVITYWPLNDALIQTYTLPYLRLIRKQLPKSSIIYLVTLNKTTPSKKAETELIKNGIELISFKYFPFGVKAMLSWVRHFLKLKKLVRTKSVDAIHCFCTPAGAAGYILSVITRKPLVLDSFEPHAEPMLESGTWKRNSLAFKLLFWLEKKQAKKAKAIIATTTAMELYAKKKYGATFQKMFVKPACINLDQFSMLNRKKEKLVKHFGFNGKIVAVYAGKFGGSYLEQEVFKLFKTACDVWKDKFRVLLLNNQPSEYIYSMCNAANLNPSIVTQTFVKHSEIADYIGLGDFGVTPFKPVPSKRYGTPIKTGEYWALGLPVVITPNISDDSDIIEKENIGAIWHPNQNESYMDSVSKIDQLLSENNMNELYQKIRPVAEKHRNFKIADNIYKNLYGSWE